MSVRPSEPSERLVAEYDLERVELIRSARIPREPTLVALRDGPCDGYTQSFDIAPDLLRLDEPEGRYVPLLVEPTTYVWLGGVE